MGACTYTAAPGAQPADGVYTPPSTGAGATQKMRRLQVAGSATYAAGGETLNPAAIGLKNINKILVEPFEAAQAASQPGLSVQLAGTPQAPLLKMYETTGTEVGAVNVSARPFIIWFIGD